MGSTDPVGALVNRAAVVATANAADRRAGDAAASIIVAALRPGTQTPKICVWRTRRPRPAEAGGSIRRGRSLFRLWHDLIGSLAARDLIDVEALAAAVERVESMPERHRPGRAH